jgi:excisionase family DNA binding protein
VTAEHDKRRFLTIEQVAEELNSKSSLIRNLIHTGELRAFQVGGRGLWRVGRQDLEDYIADAYRRTAERIAAGELADDVPDGE